MDSVVQNSALVFHDKDSAGLGNHKFFNSQRIPKPVPDIFSATMAQVWVLPKAHGAKARLVRSNMPTMPSSQFSQKLSDGTVFFEGGCMGIE